MDLWMPGAEIHDIGDHAPTDGGPAKAIAHITWDKNATASAPQAWDDFDSLVNYFINSGKPVAPHLVWDPFSGRVAQLVPADSRSKSVMDVAGGTRTNRAGSVVIQVEAVFFPYCIGPDGKVYAKLTDTPCAGWDRLHAWISSLGVPDTWPMGRPVDFTSHRDEHTWETVGGWYAHAHVPENDHQDPGSWPEFGQTGGSGDSGGSVPVEVTPARYQVTINGLQYGYGAHGPQVERVGEALVAHGFGSHYSVGPDQDWRDPDTLNYADFQRSLGYSGADADGVPGPSSLSALLGYEPFPGSGFFHDGQHSDVITRMGERLQQLGFSHYAQGPGPDWTEADRLSYQAFQRSLGYTGSAADGVPGPTSWGKLHVPAF